MKSSLWIMVVACAVLLGGCGSSDNPTNKASGNANNSNAPLAADANVNTSSANTSGETASSFEIPKTKPIENGKTESAYGISFTIPADWKPKKEDYGISYQSPGSESEKVEIYVITNNDTREGDLMSRFTEMRKRNPTRRVRMRAVDGTLGVLYLDILGDRDFSGNRDLLIWFTYPEPDAEGKSEEQAIRLTCPAGKYEQYKQLMFDILDSVKLKK
ncbi:MAG: hypothetical protein H0U54_14575 [Acidobacteria bacterium]|nr:hypothetical protein [Acidobacteriota bacterium]